MTRPILAFYVSALLLAAVTARAVPLPPGGTITPNGLGGGGGTQLGSDDGDFAFGGVVGDLNWTVTADTLIPDPVDPALALRFAYVIRNHAESASEDPILRVELADFSGVEIDLVFNPFCFGDVVPTSATRTLDGRVVTLEFTGVNEIIPDFSTRCIYLRTNGADFDSNGSITLHSLAGMTALPGPQPTPEPEAGALASLLALTGLRARAAANRADRRRDRGGRVRQNANAASAASASAPADGSGAYENPDSEAETVAPGTGSPLASSTVAPANGSVAKEASVAPVKGTELPSWWPVVAMSVAETRNSTGMSSRIGTSTFTTVSRSSFPVNVRANPEHGPSSTIEPGSFDVQVIPSCVWPKPFCQAIEVPPTMWSGRRRKPGPPPVPAVTVSQMFP
jgi:hypothetical protein